MKLIKSGEIDSAFGKLHDWYPQIVQVDSSFCEMLLQFFFFFFLKGIFVNISVFTWKHFLATSVGMWLEQIKLGFRDIL